MTVAYALWPIISGTSVLTSAGCRLADALPSSSRDCGETALARRIASRYCTRDSIPHDSRNRRDPSRSTRFQLASSGPSVGHDRQSPDPSRRAADRAGPEPSLRCPARRERARLGAEAVITPRALIARSGAKSTRRARLLWSKIERMKPQCLSIILASLAVTAIHAQVPLDPSSICAPPSRCARRPRSVSRNVEFAERNGLGDLVALSACAPRPRRFRNDAHARGIRQGRQLRGDAENRLASQRVGDPGGPAGRRRTRCTRAGMWRRFSTGRQTAGGQRHHLHHHASERSTGACRHDSPPV